MRHYLYIIPVLGLPRPHNSPKLATKGLGALCALILWLSIGLAEAQVNQQPVGYFLNDSLVIGRPVYFSLSYRHATTDEIFFPDSTYDFAPFEMVGKKTFSSVTDGGLTLDSALYELTSFEVATIQSLRLPLFLYNGRDCTQIFCKPDTLFLKNADRILLQNQTAVEPMAVLVPLEDEFNVSVALGTLALVIGFGTLIYWVFGRDIYKQWQLLKLQRRHLEYLRSFNRLLRSTREKENTKDAEKAIIIWKNYLERLEKKPFATYTTREIIDNMPDAKLAEALRNLDGIIYGQVKSSKMNVFLEVLKDGGTKIYKNRRKQILERQSA
ncbi:hypothetical protein CLV98_11441 [Dyadobacter jejuensis]|uniref:Uncharacterized protein n=1 Tax=Dyadobacter jejuensis TaxID=1082580 RepID=A0A316ACF9_9BACT|nr:hypothetical protein [Dyadobacter jejuensis]PWJ55272.1 hypothetical protein CLV98_11441 [Dyadobacter jejuensis]